MNKLIALLFLCVLVVSGCSKDKDEGDPNLTVDFLNQTAWRGTVEYESTDGPPNYNRIIVHDKFGLTFSSENSGTYELQDYNDPAGERISRGYFNYSVNAKRFRFQPVPVHELAFLRGDWLVMEKSARKLKMGLNLGSAHDYWIMELQKVY